MPAGPAIEVSTDEVSYRRIATAGNTIGVDDYDLRAKDWVAGFEPTDARLFRVLARNPGTIPSWHPGRGSEMFIFVDELLFEIE